MDFLKVDGSNRHKANLLIKNRWHSTDMIIRGEVVDLTRAEGIMAVENDEILGLVTYLIRDSICEITSLDSLMEGKGIGTGLIGRVVDAAKAVRCKKIMLETTNDNIDAIRFYQKRGFDMVRLHYNSLEEARKLKPEIPLMGNDGIPLRHNIEFEMRL